MDMYMKCGAPHKATVVFNQISTKSTACWNVLIDGHLKSCQPFEALNLFSLMAQDDHEFDLITLANGVRSCANLGLLRVGKSIHGYMFRTGVVRCGGGVGAVVVVAVVVVVMVVVAVLW
ncbi:putative tetratricopeptide-like helical domain superfamily [Helianthus annuus]|nr:putative tetratricopeptide-like helical domain superfamily [Helianthus annuus]